MTLASIAIFALPGLVTYWFLVYPLFVSPLAKIPPGHPTAAVSPLWILWIRWTGKENATIHRLHQKHGPLVRLGPAEISVNCVDGGIRTIYSGGYEKGQWYSYFENYSTTNAFSSLQHSAHSAKRRLTTAAYAKSTLHSSPALAAMSEILMCHRLLPRLMESKGQPIEAYELFSACAIDFVTAYIFGLKASANYLQNPEALSKRLKVFKSRQAFSFWYQEVPGLTSFLQRIGLRRLIFPKWLDKANAEIDGWLLDLCNAAEDVVRKGSIESGDQPVVYSQLRSALNKQSGIDFAEKGTLPGKERIETASELNDHTLAGFDTTGITLTYLSWELSKAENLGVQKALRDELRSIPTQFRATKNASETLDIPDAKTLDSLPVLHSVIMETLRLHAAIDGQQPRVTPSNASLGPPTCAIDGIPANVRVSSRAYTLHRNPEVFPDPEQWKPQRWLDSQGRTEQGGEKARWFWAFGSGGRMCIGSNLAMTEMKNIVAAIWSNFATTVVDDSGMVHTDGYTSEPKGSPEGNYLLLRFAPLD